MQQIETMSDFFREEETETMNKKEGKRETSLDNEAGLRNASWATASNNS